VVRLCKTCHGVLHQIFCRGEVRSQLQKQHKLMCNFCTPHLPPHLYRSQDQFQRNKQTVSAMVSPLTARSHYGNPLVTAVHTRTPSSPSSFAKETSNKQFQADSWDDRRGQDQQQHQEQQPMPHPLSMGSHGHASGPLGPRPQRLVTPNPSFAERADSQTMEYFSDSSWPLPQYVPEGSASSPQAGCPVSPNYQKRASVGLPSQYPSNSRGNSLVDCVLEELQDFEELFEAPPSATLHHRPTVVDGSSSMEFVVDETIHKSQSLGAATSIPASFSRHQLLDASSSVSQIPVRRHHRRSRNQALGSSDFSQVLKQL